MMSVLIAMLGSVSVTVTTPEPVGDMYVSVCSRDTFMTGNCEHRAMRAAQSEDVFVFEDVPSGRWAVQVWRDPESDGEMRTMLFGIPAEPVAISNNPPARMGPPRFADAAIRVGADGAQLAISIN